MFFILDCRSMRLQESLYFLFFALLYCVNLVASDLEGGPVGCRSSIADFKRVTMHSQVLLNKNFLNQRPNAAIQSAIELQLKHLMGYFNNTSENGLNVALSAYREAPVLLKTENIKYGHQLIIDNYLSEQNYKFSIDAYTQKALKRGYTESNDDALLITYKTNILIADCSDKSFSAESEAKLPLDPFLSLWVEDAAKRKSREFNGKNLLVSNCSADEIVDFGQIGLSWFFWSPITLKKNKKEIFLHCEVVKNLLISPKFEVAKIVSKINPPGKDFFKAENALAISAIFGVVWRTDQFTPLNYNSVDKMVNLMLTHCQQAENIPACLSVWKSALGPQEDGKYLELGAHSFFEYLRYLMTVVKLSSFTTVKNSEDLQLKLSGVFRDSGKPLTISVYYGKTSFNSKTPVPETYIKFLNTSLKSADSISYFGHAGLGLNLNFSILSDAFKKKSSSNFRRTKNLWLGIYNCEAFSYFGFDLYPIFVHGQKLLLTQTSGIEVDAKFPIAQIEIINRLFSESKLNTFSILNNYVATSDFLTETMLTF